MADSLAATRHSGLKAWIFTLFVAGLLFCATANRGAQWQDSGLHQVRIITNQITNPFGIATAHPLHFYLGRLFYLALPVEPGFAITLLSAVAGAIAVANLALLVFRLTGNGWATLITGASLAMGHTFWQHATHTESYTLVAALLTAEWIAIERFVTTRKYRWLAGLFLFNGLGVANHMLAALATPIDGVLVVLSLRRARQRWKPILSCVVIWLIGCAPLLGMMWNDYQAQGDLAATIHSTLFGRFAGSVLNTSLSLGVLGRGFGFIAYNFPGLALPLAVYALVKGRSMVPEPLLRVILIEVVIYTGFVLRYAIVDQYSYFFVIYLFVALFAGIGVARLRIATRERTYRRAVGAALIMACWTPGVYVATATVLKDRHALAGAVGNKPYRNGYRSMLVPWGVGDDHADRLNHQLVHLSNDKTTIIAEDQMIAFGIEYAKACRRIHPSVTIVVEKTPESIRQTIAGAPGDVIIVPRDRDNPILPPDGYCKREGDIYVLNDNDGIDRSR